MENSQSDPAGNGQPAAANSDAANSDAANPDAANPDAANRDAASPPEAAAPPAQPAAAEDAPAAASGVTDEPAPPQAAAEGDAAGGEATAAAPGATEEEAAPPQAVAAPAPDAAEQAEAGEPTVAVAATAPAGRPRKRVLTGNVVSDKGNRTIVVSIARRKKHRLYKKYVTLTKKLKAHDPDNECRTGDLVRVIESRPLSREKRWRLVEIVKRAG